MMTVICFDLVLRDFAKISLLWMQEAIRLEEFKKSVEAKIALRQSNLNPERPGQFSKYS